MKIIKKTESTHIYVSLLFIKYISVWQKNVRLFCTKTKQNKIKTTTSQPKPLQIVNTCNNYSDVNLMSDTSTILWNLCGSRTRAPGRR